MAELGQAVRMSPNDEQIAEGEHLEEAQQAEKKEQFISINYNFKNDKLYQNHKRRKGRNNVRKNLLKIRNHNIIGKGTDRVLTDQSLAFHQVARSRNSTQVENSTSSSARVATDRPIVWIKCEAHPFFSSSSLF